LLTITLQPRGLTTGGVGKIRQLTAPIILASLAWGTLASSAQEQLFEVNDQVRASGGIGYSFIKGDEIVYDGDGNRISHLIWESQAPTVNAAVQADFAHGWSLRASGTMAMSGNSRMEDYDWLDPYFVSYDFNDWTHRSIHPDTQLHHYFTGDVAFGRDLPLGAAILNLNVGAKYTSVFWTAFGGSFVYSDTGYRADIGSFQDGQPSISFQQRYPGVFVGADLEATAGRWSFEGQVRGGVSIGATDTDHHWARNLRFEERYGVIPFATAAARVGYAFNDNASFFLGGNFDQYFHKIGDATLYSISTGAQGPTYRNGAGMTLRAITVTGGFKARF